MYSGYCCVIGLRKICLNVTPKPFSVEETGLQYAAHTATTNIAVTTALIVATGSSTFHPKRMSWS